MPIVTIQRRMAEQGRIRLGEKVATSNGKTRPSKLETFRFTSPNERLIRAIADLYGGGARRWDNAGKAEFEVLTEAKSIPVIVVKGGFSQWMETWASGECVHRCDGEKSVEGVFCDQGDPAHSDAKPTTRLSVMLRDVETIGVWRLESRGWNAAQELPSMAELAMHVGDLVPATLNLVERSSRIEVNGKKTTSRYVVPMLDLAVSKQRLVEIVGNQTQGIAAPGPSTAPQIGGTEAAQIAAPSIDFMAAAREATSPDELRQIWRSAGEHNALTDELKSLIQSRVTDFTAVGTDPTDYDEDEEPGKAAQAQQNRDDVDDAWNKLVAAAGEQNIGTSNLRSMLEQEYAAPVADLTADQLLAFIPKVAA